MNKSENAKPTEPVTVAHAFRFNWWLLALRGLLAVAFGVLAFAWPGPTLLSLVWLFGAFALLNGILSFVLAVKAPKGYAKPGSLILGGLVGILVGLLTFVMPGITALGLILLIAAWAMATGVTEIVTAVKLRKVLPNEWLLGLAGIASVVFGVLLCVQPGIGALVLVWWIAEWALVFGFLLIALAFRMRHAKGGISDESTVF